LCRFHPSHLNLYAIYRALTSINGKQATSDCSVFTYFNGSLEAQNEDGKTSPLFHLHLLFKAYHKKRQKQKIMAGFFLILLKLTVFSDN